MCQVKIRVYSHRVLLCARKKTPMKLPAEQKPVKGKQPLSYVNNLLAHMGECENDSMELKIKESEEEWLRRRIKELELSLERETA